MKSWRQLHRLPRYPWFALRGQRARPPLFAQQRRVFGGDWSFASEASPPGACRDADGDSTDTIYALSTAPGRAAIAVVRISGPACLDVYRGLCPDRPLPQARRATLRKLYDATTPTTVGGPPRLLDSGALVLFFPAPNTSTGESILELHLHGGPAIVKSVLEAIPRSVNGTKTRDSAAVVHRTRIRPAEPGEFTMRAFYNARLTLTQAEALGEVLAAETEQQRRLAVLGTDGGLSRRYEAWRQMLLHARGELEALIDFSEDQHFDESPAELIASTAAQVAALERLVTIYIENASKGELLRSGISLALLGAPNAGKSSLLNRIVGREAAIVSAEAGTTRDIVDVSVDIDGWLCRIGDMAGLRRGWHHPTSANASAPSEQEVGLVEREGIRRARQRALQSDIILVVVALEPGPDGSPVVPVNAELAEAVRECRAAGREIVLVLTKGDVVGDADSLARHLPRLAAALESEFGVQAADAAVPVFAISCLDCARIGTPADPGNIQAFLRGLTAVFASLTASSDGPSNLGIDAAAAPRDQSCWSASLSITHRQRAHLEQCLTHLRDFLAQAASDPSLSRDDHDHPIDGGEVDIVTAAEHLRYAASCLARITGRGEGGDVEDVLGVVFEK